MSAIVTHDAEYAARFPDDERVDWRNPSGRLLSPLPIVATAYMPPTAHIAGSPFPFEIEAPAVRPRVLQMTRYDPGNAAYRYHSALNSLAREQLDVAGVSAFARFEHDSAYCDLRQYDGILQRAGVRRLADSADVVHVHMDYSTLSEPRFLGQWPDRSRQLLVRHYHGSQPTIESVPTVLVENALDANEDAVQIGARLYHQRFSSGMHWLPIPMPVLDYASLREQHWRPIDERPNKAVRICHSPTVSVIKGTIILDTAISDLRIKGVPIEYIKISGKPHGEALALKASADICFDSFWLGIQGSGLEAACMGQAVIAGDADVKAEYERAIGECPYTFAAGFEELRELIEQLVVDAAFRESEAARVAQYVRTYHDYPMVAERYWRIIAAERDKRGHS